MDRNVSDGDEIVIVQQLINVASVDSDTQITTLQQIPAVYNSINFIYGIPETE